VKKVDPVTFPPGRLRLAARPSSTGSEPNATTIGIVEVAAFDIERFAAGLIKKLVLIRELIFMLRIRTN
jgi:hypothetical protein